MKIRFKNKNSRGEFSRLVYINKQIAQYIGNGCREAMNDSTYRLVLVDDRGCPIVDPNGFIYAIHKSEMKYFDIQE